VAWSDTSVIKKPARRLVKVAEATGDNCYLMPVL
jgi:hypothetical protein